MSGSHEHKVSNKPIVWGLFAAGGTVTALLLPVMVLLFGLAEPLGLLNADYFSYQRVSMLIANPLVKLILFGIIALSLWHAAHRLRITLHDFGIRADGIVAWSFYGIAMIATIWLAIILVRL